MSRSPTYLRILQLVPMFMLLSAANARVHGQNVEQIVRQASHAQDPLGNLILQAQLNVKPKSGVSREYSMEMRLRREGEDLQSWIGVQTPASLNGMQFVRNRFSATDDQLLLYIPATKQVQQIPTAAREKKFLNSDFSLADLQIRPGDLRHHQIVEDTDKHWVVAARPASGSKYEWMLFTIDKNDYALLRVSFYIAQHKLVKDLFVREFTSDGEARLPKKIEMVDKITDSRSTLVIRESRTQVSDSELPSETFTAAYMRDVNRR